MKRYLSAIFLVGLLSCNSDEGEIPPSTLENGLYFPPTNSGDWETTAPENQNWNTDAIVDLYSFLSEGNTRAFIVLKDGKIVLEKYWGNNLLNSDIFDQNTNWYWASAGKTLTAFIVGLAQQEGILDINDKTSDYLGNNWSKLSLNKENLITVKHQLTMTTGLDYMVANLDCTDAVCLQYRQDAGTQWYYHNAPYTLLESVVSNAAGMTYNQFTDVKIEGLIGMDGTWILLGNNNVYWSTARSAARFGLLLLNKGTWDKTPILTDPVYFDAMTNSSQNLNPSYGYLTWLNGKASIILPGLATSFNTPLSQNAPSDLYAALGKNGQYINVVPSENLVVVRMGDAPGNALVSAVFHDDLWGKISQVIN